MNLRADSIIYLRANHFVFYDVLIASTIALIPDNNHDRVLLVTLSADAKYHYRVEHQSHKLEQERDSLSRLSIFLSLFAVTDFSEIRYMHKMCFFASLHI